MFKYISEIISNISPRQRFFALVVTLFTILLLTLGNNLISAFTNSDQILENKVQRLENSNNLLSEQNRELQTIVIQSQIQCTKDITQLRQQIVDELSQIEREMNMSQRALQTTTILPNDTIMMSQPIRVIPTNTQAMTHLKSMKKKLQDDMKDE
jgi:uncharacterized membrane protein YhiD involved in acid resistance